MQFWKVKLLTYVSAIYLYRWYALATAWAVCLIGWAAVAALPDQYTAEAKVYIDSENIMDPLLKGLTISVDPGQEIAIMLRTLITRPTLEQVIHLTNPSANSLSPAQMELQVEALQDKISIRQLETKNYFAIGYTNNSAQYATSVTQTLLSILQDNKVGNSRLDMDTARTFINKKVQEYEDRLRDADKRRADFRTANVEILSKGTAANRIDTADTALELAKRDLNAATATRDSLKSQLATTPKTIPVDERMFIGNGLGGVNIDGVGAKGMVAAPPANTMARLQQAQATLDDLLTRYTDQHPEVIAERKLIAQLQAQLSATPDKSEADVPSIMVPNPAYVQLQSKLSDEEALVAAQHQHLATAQAELEKAKADASKAIDITAQYDGLDRDYGNIEKTYQELLQSRESASLSQARDDQNQGISFRVLEPPQQPQFPAAPNRLLFNSLVLLLGLGCGAGVGILLMLNAGRFITSEDVETQFGVPLIGVITTLPQAIAAGANRLSTYALSGAVGLLLLSYIGVIAVFRTSIYSVLGI